jgi:hypothetical protein
MNALDDLRQQAVEFPAETRRQLREIDPKDPGASRARSEVIERRKCERQQLDWQIANSTLEAGAEA